MDDVSGDALRAKIPAGCRRVLVARPPFPAPLEASLESLLAAETFTVTFTSGAEGSASPVPARSSWDGFFDAVLFPHVLEHLEDPSEALVRVRTWLAPQGRVIASIANAGSIAIVRGLLAGSFEEGTSGTPLRLFARGTARDLFEACGYAVESIDGVAAELTGPDRALLDKLRRLPGASPDLAVTALIIVARAAA